MPNEIISISKKMKSNIITAIQFSEIPKKSFKERTTVISEMSGAIPRRKR